MSAIHCGKNDIFSKKKLSSLGTMDIKKMVIPMVCNRIIKCSRNNNNNNSSGQHRSEYLSEHSEKESKDDNVICCNICFLHIFSTHTQHQYMLFFLFLFLSFFLLPYIVFIGFYLDRFLFLPGIIQILNKAGKKTGKKNIR